MVRNEEFDAVTIGENTPETISGTGASLSFTGNADRDIHDATDVTLSNGTAASITEDVTVNYYEGADAMTGTLLESETQSITLAAGTSSTTTFLTGDFGLGLGNYFVEVTTTNLTADTIAEHTLGAEYVTEQGGEGDLVTIDQNGRERERFDATSGSVTYPAVETDQAHIGASNGTADNILTEPGENALREGYLVGYSPHYSITVDPRDFASDVAAIQHVNDELIALMGGGKSYGYLYIPVWRPDGTPYTIDSTVTIGDDSVYRTVIPRGWGFGGAHGNALNITINDGSPAFHMVGSPNGMATQLNATWFGGFVGDAGGNDAEFFRLSDVTGFRMVDIQAKGFGGGLASGAYVFDGACWNSYINHVNYNGDFAGAANLANANAYAIVDDTLNGPPGELKFGPGCSTYSDPAEPFNNGLHITTRATAIAWGGRLEGAGGDGLIYQTNGYLHLTGSAELGRCEGTADKVHFEGIGFVAADGVNMQTNGPVHGYHLTGSVLRGYVGVPLCSASNMAGDTIHVEATGSDAHRLIVPYENSVNGSVTYPAPPWEHLTYPDGWQKFRTGTTTITGNSTTTIDAWAGRAYWDMRLANLSFAVEPTADVRYKVVRGYSNTNNRHWVGVEETTGNSFDLNWEVHVQR